jgi:hypothetical protein
MVHGTEFDKNTRRRFGRRREYFMIRKIAFALALTFAASIFVQVAAVSQADAGSTCTYTSSDKKKGYKC